MRGPSVRIKEDMKSFFKLVFVMAIILVSAISVSAKTTVYVFIPKVGNTDFTLLIDGEQKCKLNTPTIKTTDNSAFKIPLKQNQPGYIEIEFENEGKNLLSVSMEYTNSMTLEKNVMQAEIQLNLQDGETIYLDVARKGWSDVKLKELDMKKGIKKLANKKLYQLPSIVIDNE